MKAKGNIAGTTYCMAGFCSGFEVQYLYISFYSKTISEERAKGEFNAGMEQMFLRKRQVM